MIAYNDRLSEGLSSGKYTYRGILYFFTCFLIITFGAAILTYPSYAVVGYINKVIPNPTTDWLVHKRIDIYFDRCRLVLTAISLPILLKICGLLSFRNLQLEFDIHGKRCFAKMFVLGFMLSGAIIILQNIFIGLEARETDAIGVLIDLSSAILGTLIIAFLEEIIFRGLILRCFCAAMRAPLAVVLTSLFFAYKHFKVPSVVFKTMPTAKTPDFFSGFYSAWFDTIGISYNFNLITFLALFALGVLLSVVYLKNRSLCASIGLHAGIIFAIFLLRKFLEYKSVPSPTESMWLGSNGLSDGVVAMSGLLLLCIFFIFKKYKNA